MLFSTPLEEENRNFPFCSTFFWKKIVGIRREKIKVLVEIYTPGTLCLYTLSKENTEEQILQIKTDVKYTRACSIRDQLLFKIKSSYLAKNCVAKK